MIKRVFSKARTVVNRQLRKGINSKNISRLKNKDVTLIASNCNGCMLLHDLNMRFNSPFVNLYIEADDYVRLLKNFDYYMQQDISFIPSDESYPVGMLGDVKIYFVHYKDEKHVLEKWNERKKRMDMSNFYIIFTDRDGCTKEHLIEFDNLPYKNKVVFTHKEHPDIKSAYCIKGFENAEAVGPIYTFSGWNGKKYYDQFDFISWFNNN